MSDLRAPLEASLSSAYRLERELGSGGMAVVFLAQDLRHKRRVALKVLRPEISAIMAPGAPAPAARLTRRSDRLARTFAARTSRSISFTREPSAPR
jgi:serine/threonine protein kinase